MFSTGPPDDVHWLVVGKEPNKTATAKPYKNTCTDDNLIKARMSPALAGTHKCRAGTNCTLAPYFGEESTIPYKMTVDKETVKAGEVITLKIIKRENSAKAFKGFMVQGVNQESGEILGIFDVLDDDPIVRKMTCSGAKGSSVSHKDAKANPSLQTVSMKWRAPTLKENATVKIQFTVVQSLHKFWVKKDADVVLTKKDSDTFLVKGMMENSKASQTNSRIQLHQLVMIFVLITASFPATVMLP